MNYPPVPPKLALPAAPIKVFSVEFIAEPGSDEVISRSEVLRGLKPYQILRCLGQVIEEALAAAQGIAEENKLTPGQMNKMMRGAL